MIIAKLAELYHRPRDLNFFMGVAAACRDFSKVFLVSFLG